MAGNAIGEQAPIGTMGGGKAAFLRKGGGRWVLRSFLPEGIGEKVVGAAPRSNFSI